MRPKGFKHTEGTKLKIKLANTGKTKSKEWRAKIARFEQAMRCSELWDINNGRILCVDCHKGTDNYLKNFKKSHANSTIHI